MNRCVSEGRLQRATSNDEWGRGQSRGRSDVSATTGSKRRHQSEIIQQQTVAPISNFALSTAGRGQTLAVLDEHRLPRGLGRLRTSVLLTHCAEALG